MNEIKIDKRHNYISVIDTETANGLDDPLFYDVGWVIADTMGRIYVERSFVNADIYLDEKEMMTSAYYAKKLPQYEKDLRDGTRQLATLFTIWKQYREDCKTYGVKAVMAHNMRFDYRSLNGTMRYLTKSKFRYFIPYGIEIWDSMKVAEYITEMPSYQRFCEKYNLLNYWGKPSRKAEDLFRFISKDPTFTECHTGLEDVFIELEIFNYVKRQHRPFEKKLWEN